MHLFLRETDGLAVGVPGVVIAVEEHTIIIAEQ